MTFGGSGLIGRREWTADCQGGEKALTRKEQRIMGNFFKKIRQKSRQGAVRKSLESKRHGSPNPGGKRRRQIPRHEARRWSGRWRGRAKPAVCRINGGWPPPAVRGSVPVPEPVWACPPTRGALTPISPVHDMIHRAGILNPQLLRHGRLTLAFAMWSKVKTRTY